MLLSAFEDQTKPADGAPKRLDRLTSLQHLWEDKRVDGRLPAKSDFPPEELRHWLGHIFLVDVAHDPVRFRMRLMGVKLVTYTGTDFTGKWLDEVSDGEKLQWTTQPHLTCVETKEPCYDRIASLQHQSKTMTFHRVHLPCADDGRNVNVILGCGYLVEDDSAD